MKKSITTIVLFATTFAFSQVIIIKGKLGNQENKPIAFAEILLLNQGNIAIKSEITNEDGSFSVEVSKDNYKLQIKKMGVILYQKEISVIQNLDLGIIQITEDTQQLKEVVVTGKKKLIERKVDRLVFNLENSISATGGDAIDALKVTPGIRVQNDQIKMIGKSGMAVMVDDRLIQLSGDDLINFLKTISSDNIKSIEVITTPPAKYDAEGNSGIVNIKLKKAKRDSWSATTKMNYKQATYLSGGLGGNFSYQKDKWGVLLDLSQKRGKFIYTNDLTYDYAVENWKNKVLNKTNQNSTNSLVGLTYDITDKSKLGVQYLGSFNNVKVNEDNYSNIYNNQTNVLDTNLNSNGFTNRKIDNNSLNLNLVTKLDTIGKQFSINADYFAYQSNKTNTFNSESNDFLTSITKRQFNDNGNKQRISNFSSNIDFEMPYQWASLNFGAKISFVKSSSDLKTFFYDNNNDILTPNSSQANVFEYKENNQALYFSTDKNIGDKWELKAGLRLEFTQTTGFSQTENTTNRIEYYKLFPSLYVSYKNNEKNTWSANYSRRINRPSYSELNPARWYFNSNSYEEGNPFLQPSFSHNIELSHTFKELLVSTLYLSKTENGNGQLTVHDEANNIQRFIRLNYFDQRYIGIDETFTYDIFKWWNAINNIGTFYSETSAYSEYLQPKYSGWGGYLSTTNSFVLNKSKTCALQLTYSYNFPEKSQESTTSPYSNFNIAIRYALLNKKLQLSFVADDILKTNQYTIRNKTQDVNQSFRQYYDTQSFRISISYKFGSDKINVQKRDFGNQGEMNRIGN